MLRRVISCSPGSLQLAVTHVGQFLKCISSGNKALNLFGWKQLVVSQIQMPTRVLSANLLDECWIDFFFLFLIFRKTLGVKEGELLVLFLQEFCLLSDQGQKGRLGRVPCSTVSGRSWQGWRRLLFGALGPLGASAQAQSDCSFSKLCKTPVSLYVCFCSWNSVVVQQLINKGKVYF